jgi:hypothetical protein
MKLSRKATSARSITSSTVESDIFPSFQHYIPHFIAKPSQLQYPKIRCPTEIFVPPLFYKNKRDTNHVIDLLGRCFRQGDE